MFLYVLSNPCTDAFKKLAPYLLIAFVISPPRLKLTVMSAALYNASSTVPPCSIVEMYSVSLGACSRTSLTALILLANFFIGFFA